MIEIPKWDEALHQFTVFLKYCGLSNEIEWVFRDDIWRRPSAKKVLIRNPVHKNNMAFSRRVFETGREKGLVELLAIGSDETTTFCTVWYPNSPEKETQGWDHGMKLTMMNPLAKAKRVAHFLWPIFGLQPEFRQYQRFETCVPARMRDAT
jgi:hypothetical protein